MAQAKLPSPQPMRMDDAGRLIVPPSTKQREQVVAETLEAARLGLIQRGELGLFQATAEQERLIELAGERAIARSATAE